jgi:glycosyltransferase involved in cell wall biosynthesis
VVHLHGYTKALTTAPVRAATDRGFKVVCTLHDFFAACPNGAFFDYVQNAPCERRALSASCVLANCDKRNRAHKLYRTLRSGIQAWPGRFPAAVDAYISLSNRSAEILRPYLAADARLYPLENMIPMRRREPVRVGEGNAVLAVGRLDREKGVEILLEASRRAEVVVTFVGDGPLRSLVEQNPLCRVTGWLSPAEVEAELEHARCLAFPSLWYETYGLVVSEAAARGVPSIVSDVCAPTERIRHGETGWIFLSGDVDRLASCLAVTRDGAVLERVGRAAYDAFWAAPPDRDRHVRGLIAIYGDVLASAARAPLH